MYHLLLLYLSILLHSPVSSSGLKTIVFPPIALLSDSSGASSLGDQLLILGTIAALKCSGRFQSIDLNLHNALINDFQRKLERDIETYFHLVPCKSSSPSAYVTLSFLHNDIEGETFNLFNNTYHVLQVIAADCLDGYYSEDNSLSRWKQIFHSSMRYKVNILSASFDRKKLIRSPKLVAYLQNHSNLFYSKNLTFFARDSPSYQDFLTFFVPSASIRVTDSVLFKPDLAFNAPLVVVDDIDINIVYKKLLAGES